MTKSDPTRAQLLPGVRGQELQNFNATRNFASEIARARVQANRRDLVDVLLLLLVDLLFVSWEQATVPFLSRDVTVSLLLLLHVGIALSVFRTRILPSFTARRIASTWSSVERQRIRA